MILLLALFAVTILVAAGVALWRHGTWTWVEVRHGLALTGLLSLTVAAVLALSVSDGGLPLWAVVASHVGLAGPVAALWVAWARVEKTRSTEN